MSSPATILLVDDYRDALDIWDIYLSGFGFHVVTATNGADALALAEQQRPAVVVTDLELPGISGFDVARQLRAQPHTSTVPLIAVTGYSHVVNSDQAREAGFDRVIVKPCPPDVLLEEIRRVLDSRPSRES
ncbi:MAG: response regulator [Vicinamibacterales bacterium]